MRRGQHTRGFRGRSNADTFAPRKPPLTCSAPCRSHMPSRSAGPMSVTAIHGWERAMRRWISRMRRRACAPRTSRVGLLVVAPGPLRTEFGQLALNVLLTARDELPRAAPMQREVGPCASGSVPTRMAKDSTVVTTLA